MIINRNKLLELAPIKDMVPEKRREHGVSYGLSEAGYDIRIRQTTELSYMCRFALASTVEEFDMPDCLVGVVHDKSTWARQGIGVFNTVIEPGWRGVLTLELFYHGRGRVVIPAGAGIAQVLFHALEEKASYQGKYQDQSSNPTEARFDCDQERVEDGGEHFCRKL